MRNADLSRKTRESGMPCLTIHTSVSQGKQVASHYVIPSRNKLISVVIICLFSCESVITVFLNASSDPVIQ